MKKLLFCISVIILSSCSKTPFAKWSADLVELENQLIKQKKESNRITVPDVFLFNGVYNATKKKEAEPYPIIKKLANGLENENKILTQKTDSCLTRISEFKSKHGENPLKTIGPEWSDYTALLSQIKTQTEKNHSALANIQKSDQVFDSICQANKIKSVPLLEYEALLAANVTELEDEFVELSNTYHKFKREITTRESRETSMKAIGEMKQKIRRIESEQLQMSNLYSRINSLRSDAMLFEGPFIDKTAEIQLIENKTKLIEELLGQLRRMENSYVESE